MKGLNCEGEDYQITQIEHDYSKFNCYEKYEPCRFTKYRQFKMDEESNINCTNIADNRNKMDINININAQYQYLESSIVIDVCSKLDDGSSIKWIEPTKYYEKSLSYELYRHSINCSINNIGQDDNVQIISYQKEGCDVLNNFYYLIDPNDSRRSCIQIAILSIMFCFNFLFFV